jgi:hypothetical protein
VVVLFNLGDHRVDFKWPFEHEPQPIVLGELHREKISYSLSPFSVAIVKIASNH